MSELVEFMSQYGWPGIIALIVVLAMFIIYKKIKNETSSSLEKGFAKVTDTIASGMTEQNNRLITAINDNNKEMLRFIMRGKDEEHERSIDARMDVAEQILQNIRDLSNITGASRVCVLEFHNSKENFSGLSFVWYDMHYEWPAKGVEPITDIIKNVQVARLLPIVKRINHTPNTRTIILDRKALEALESEEPLLYYDLVKKLDLNHVVYSGLYDTHCGKLIGLLAVEFNYEISYEEVAQYETEYENTASVVANLLTFTRKTD